MHLRPKESKSAASHSEVAASWPDLPGSGEMLWLLHNQRLLGIRLEILLDI